MSGLEFLATVGEGKRVKRRFAQRLAEIEADICLVELLVAPAEAGIRRGLDALVTDKVEGHPRAEVLQELRLRPETEAAEFIVARAEIFVVHIIPVHVCGLEVQASFEQKFLQERIFLTLV